jgi:hypothetical protein
MVNANLTRTVLFAIGLAAGFGAAQTTTTLSVTPNPAPAGQTFVLSLLGLTNNACTTFSRESVTVTGNRIDLRYTATTYGPIPAQSGAGTQPPVDYVCPLTMPPVPDAVGGSIVATLPRFDMPALKAGQYEVWAANMPACLYSQPTCLIAVMPVSAGVLTVQGATPTKHVSWYLKEKTVAADKAFQMQLLRDSLPACTIFSHPSVSLLGNSLYASFLMGTDSAAKCTPISANPIGPVFAVPALKVGLYPVYPQELAACQVAQPPCYPPVRAPIPTDTLVVTNTLAIGLSQLRAGAPRVELRGGNAVFALPAGEAGIWRAVLTTLDGRVLAEARIPGAAGDRISMSMARAPAHGASLLRLTSPDGVQHLLPIVK